MSARSYLSIGDVLTLLRQEFPDITISKIRFLESQGLVNPERTPSGYRKFYEHDVERLRWVLRQQREHFLPLKVIKDRLDDGSATVDADTIAEDAAHTTVPVDGGRPDAATTDVREKDPVLVGHRVGAEEGRSAPLGARPAGEAPRPLTGDGAALPGIGSSGDGGVEHSSARAASRPAAATHRRGADRTPLLELVDEQAVAASASPPPAADSALHAGDGVSAGTASGRSGTGAARSASSASAARRAKPAATSTSESGPSPRAPKGGGKPSASSSASSSPPPAAPITPKPALPGSGGVNLSAEELATASGLDVTVLRELQEYGLLVATTVAGVEHFGEEALTVATAAAGFTHFGIEPRHLRLYKNGAEREAGFVEQVVLPLVRQRNPEARIRAHETAEELTQLGLQLRGSLLRTALGNLLDG